MSVPACDSYTNIVALTANGKLPGSAKLIDTRRTVSHGPVATTPAEHLAPPTLVSSTMKITLIAANAENGTIGDDGTVPWNYPADLEHFRETTLGHPVILGRRTFEGVFDRNGGPLSERKNIVLTTAPRRSQMPSSASTR